MLIGMVQRYQFLWWLYQLNTCTISQRSAFLSLHSYTLTHWVLQLDYPTTFSLQYTLHHFAVDWRSSLVPRPSEGLDSPTNSDSVERCMGFNEWELCWHETQLIWIAVYKGFVNTPDAAWAVSGSGPNTEVLISKLGFQVFLLKIRKTF